MSEPRTTVDRLREVTRLFAEIQEVVDLVARVIAKYPYETLPPRLQQFRGGPPVSFVRPSTRDDSELVLQVSNGFPRDRTLRIPTQWLSLQQSQITAAVRKIYWADSQHRRTRGLQRLLESAQAHEKRAADYTRKAIADRQAYDALSQRRISKRPTKG